MSYKIVDINRETSRQQKGNEITKKGKIFYINRNEKTRRQGRQGAVIPPETLLYKSPQTKLRTYVPALDGHST
jgi:hypothetical protein